MRSQESSLFNCADFERSTFESSTHKTKFCRNMYSCVSFVQFCLRSKRKDETK